MKKLFFIIPVVLLLSSACEDYELTKSIFIPDPENSDLPAYSEWGYNTFGVLVDRKPFVNESTGIPGKIINTDGVTTFELIGHSTDDYFYGGNGKPGRLIFELPDISPRFPEDLLVLQNVTIDLLDPEAGVSFADADGTGELEIISGSLLFKRAQNLIVDRQPSFVILSGTFQFQALIDGTPVSFSMGRFDISFNQDNFFYY